MVTKPVSGQAGWDVPLNAALDDLQSQATNLQSQTSTLQSQMSSTQALISQLGIYVPNGWGANWKAKRNSGTAVMHAIGSSATQGYYSSNLRANGWVDLVRSSLQSQYGDGGSGFRSTSASSVWANANGVTAGAVTAYSANGNYMTPSGSWSVGGNSYGPGVTYLFTSTVGDNVTISVRGTVVDIYTLAGSTNTHSNWTYSIDGGAAVTVPDTGTADNIVKTTITGLSTGTHSVTVTKGSTGTYLSLVGIAGRNTTGVVVNNLAKYGSRLANFFGTANLSIDWNGGQSFPADLVTLSHAPNEAVANNTGDAMIQVYRRVMETIRDANYNTDLMIVMPNVGSYDTTNFLYQDYAIRLRMLAETFNAAFVDMWTIGKNTWSYWNSLGNWSNPSVPGTAGTDSVHPSDAGYQTIYNTIYPIINGT